MKKKTVKKLNDIRLKLFTRQSAWRIFLATVSVLTYRHHTWSWLPRLVSDLCHDVFRLYGQQNPIKAAIKDIRFIRPRLRSGFSFGGIPRRNRRAKSVRSETRVSKEPVCLCILRSAKQVLDICSRDLAVWNSHVYSVAPSKVRDSVPTGARVFSTSSRCPLWCMPTAQEDWAGKVFTYLLKTAYIL